ncbi:ribonuclease H-like [Procambarus clarkii]|uniref:ribonuclease H-like n=1 Tax=Procambarus clarkii TaxID=6728 RepID=UPI0037445256
MSEQDQIIIYVDGACRGNPGKGGWGALIKVNDEEEQVLYGGKHATTNNQMELTAAIKALEYCHEESEIVIHSDSNYVIKGITEWVHNWIKKDWHGVKNVELWQSLFEVSQRRNVQWKWVKGHSGNRGNDIADALANLGIDELGR